MEHFEFDGDKYHKAAKHQTEWGGRLISQLQLNGSEKILDLGCGDGLLTARLSVLVPRGTVLGIDASQGMIDTAKKREKANLAFERMDINQMKFEDSFDVIFSNAALHWIKDHRRLLHNAYRALRPGGRIQWDFAGEGNCATFFATVQAKMKEKAYESSFRDFQWPWYMPSRQNYEKLTAEVGFSTIRVEQINADRYFSNADEMIRWLDQPSLVPFIKCVGEGEKEMFRREVIDAMLEKTMQPDGTCFETFRRIIVTAQK